jgi:hypothetical protein
MNIANNISVNAGYMIDEEKMNQKGKKSMDKGVNKSNDEESRFDINEIERSIQETVTALEKFVFDKGVSVKGKKTKHSS